MSPGRDDGDVVGGRGVQGPVLHEPWANSWVQGTAIGGRSIIGKIESGIKVMTVKEWGKKPVSHHW